jgi:gliding motility-associated-like protein
MIPDPGSISISASGGTPPLEFSIDSGATFSPDTFYLVPSEIYGVVIRDSNNCSYEESVYVSATPPLDINVSSLDIDCYDNNNGSIVLTEENGIGTVLYSIDGGLTRDTLSNFTDLAGGTYFIEVIDSYRVFRDTVIIINPPAFDVTGTVTPATCSRNTFDGSISLTVSGAEPPYDFLWSNDSTSKDISDLEENSYTITITDQSGCEYTDTFEVTAYVTLYADAGNDTAVCYGDEIMLNGSGGDEFTWSPEEGLSRIDIPDPTTVVSDSVTYVLFTRDVASGCADQDTVILTVHPDRGISAGQDTTVAPGQTITLTATGGPFSSYLWEPSDGLENPMSQSTMATVSTEITYVVTGTTEFGCPESDSMGIFIATGLNIYTGFTPNDDGTNDFWDIDDIVFYPNATVKVFDRWGKLVFSSVGYADDQRWDGKYKGKDLPTGTYYYVIDLKDGGEPYKGPVTIVR